MRPIFGVVFLGFTVLFFTALFTHACGCAGEPTKNASLCPTNFKFQALGLTQYATDHDDRLPSRDLWMDNIGPYVKEPLVFHAPETPKGTDGYALNAALSRAKLPANAEAVPLVYDSVDPIRNASDLFTSLPFPGRHGRVEKRDYVVYADGHARAVSH